MFRYGKVGVLLIGYTGLSFGFSPPFVGGYEVGSLFRCCVMLCFIAALVFILRYSLVILRTHRCGCVGWKCPGK